MFADYKKISSNVSQMIEQGAPEHEIDSYIKQDGGSVDGLKRYNEVKDKPIGKIISDNFVQSLKDVHSDVLSPIGKGLDVAAFGLPRTMLKAFDPELDKKIFQDQKTLEGKTLNLMSQARGLLKGGAAQVTARTGALIPRVAGEGIKRQVLRGAVSGAAGSTSQFIGDPAKNIIEQIGKQGVQGLIGGAIGGAFPVVGAGARKIKKGVVAFGKGAKGYISDVVAPKMSNMIKSNVQKMNPKFVDYAQKKFGVARESLEIIAKKGEAALDSVFSATRGVVDDVADRLARGLKTRGDIADDLYSQAMSVVPDDQLFNANNTQNVIRKNLLNKGLIDGAGNKTTRAGISTGPDKILLDVHDDILRTQSPAKKDFTFWRDKLSSAYKETGSTNIDVKSAVDALYDDAVDSGYQGLQEARSIYHKQMLMEGKFEKSALIKQNKLQRYNKWTVQEKSDLDELVSYIQDEFPIDAGITDDLKNTIASSDLQVFKAKTSPAVISEDLLKAKNPEHYKGVKNKWVEILGDDVVPLFDDVKQSITGETIRRVAEKAIVPVALTATGLYLGYGAYRLGSEAVQDLMSGISY